MLYSILIYDSEALVEQLDPAEDALRIEKHRALQKRLDERQALGPVARLMPSTAAVTLAPGDGKPLVLDGPFAETKEQLVGFYVFEAASLEEAIELAGELPLDSSRLEIRPVQWFNPGSGTRTPGA